MKLWLLRAIGPVGYDAYDAHVVRAETEKEARAACPTEGEGYPRTEPTFWNDPQRSTCEELTTDGEAGVIVSSFNAG